MIVHLIFLLSGSQIRSVRDTLEVNNYRLWLIHYLVSVSAYFKSQIGVLTVSRHKALIKSSDFFPKRSTDHNGSTGNIICLVDIIKFRVFRILTVSIVPRRAVSPEDSSRFLQISIRVQ